MEEKSQHAHRLIHISDVHFHVLPLNPLDCLNKRLKGLLRKVFGLVQFQATTISQRLPQVIKSLEANSVCITGDVSLTAMDAEFLLAKHFVDILAKHSSTYLLPGNHDVYTSKSLAKQTFYKYFPNQKLQHDKVSFHKLTDCWWLILLDCSCLNGWFSANGAVQLTQISAIETFLLSLSSEENVVIANHYPLLSSRHSYHDLINNTLLKNVLNKYNKVRLYLHGHEHQATIYSCADASPSCILNSGSISLPTNGRFHIIDLYPEKYQVHTIALNNLLDFDSPLEITKEATLEIRFS
ncbi:3',5'-cyclic adenosine monophosphate phosphodiesterase CpdA,cyclic 3',5'-adenosine monophosphate phosphodiesterase,Calcineurin-like phosphoesterase [Chlamydia serpentis]|uniref:3',5'-cyclic adenosine monophosphate phosphodiesterase CpdA,cyclic 3',5'-adenosine monophosphate phosphodiesterase,Calcineurin-like phosphoesterase n=1 Tax=Chlamydia serpentis TaxID=1967782 RepID=A0A2R8FCL7_9CHLA|nr:metallophosphoesterase [Chlamydia serpentis]SPN74007.1 3',5'-cyclic adenosine monophosphate phosphodiesterase CpdA,cyclic 3',5'-adenosine monophosphate phosphodiesterase,Calcineurin-like phosphoesterase [Chlamydia serpentis]